MFDQMPSQDDGDAPSVVYTGRDDLRSNQPGQRILLTCFDLKEASRKSVLELPLS